MDVITFPENLYTTSELSILLHDVIESQTQRHMIIENILITVRVKFYISFWKTEDGDICIVIIMDSSCIKQAECKVLNRF